MYQYPTHPITPLPSISPPQVPAPPPSPAQANDDLTELELAKRAKREILRRLATGHGRPDVTYTLVPTLSAGDTLKLVTGLQKLDAMIARWAKEGGPGGSNP